MNKEVSLEEGRYSVKLRDVSRGRPRSWARSEEKHKLTPLGSVRVIGGKAMYAVAYNQLFEGYVVWGNPPQYVHWTPVTPGLTQEDFKAWVDSL